MKYLSKILILSAIIITSFYSCKKDESQVAITSSNTPVLKSSVAEASIIPLKEDNKDAVALKLWWTNPNYVFTTGISSHSVTYTIEIDTTGSGFSNPSREKLIITADLSREITVGDLNAYLVRDMKLKADVSHNIEIRVVSTIGTGGAPLYSNVFKYKATPYPIVKVPLPAGGDLFLVGDATPGGWSNPVPTPSQKFTRTSTTTYEITVTINGGKHYLLLPENGSWTKKYAIEDDTKVGVENGGEFKVFTSGGKDIPAPALSGDYKIAVDFQEGSFKVTKL